MFYIKSLQKLLDFRYKVLQSQCRCGLECVPDIWYKRIYLVQNEVNVMEKAVENHLKVRIRNAGGLCLKLTGYKGIPDRIVLINGRCCFVELKDEGKKLRPEQKVWQDRLKGMGFECLMLDSKESVDEFVKGL